MPKATSAPAVAPTPDELTPLRTPELQPAIEDLTKLLSQSKRVFLLGAGCSKCAGLPLMFELTDKVIKSIDPKDDAHTILEGLVEQFKGKGSCTIEDYMSELVDLISIAERRELKECKSSEVEIAGKKYTAPVLRKALTTIKSKIREAIASENVEIHHHRQFVRAVHGRLDLGKSGSHPPVDYFTLNYDMLIEDSLSLERVPHADGFNGGATGWWDGDKYQDTAMKARVFKIHGSIDWCLMDDDVMPRRVRPDLTAGTMTEDVLIWPASTKYREAQRDPHAQIIERLRRALRPGQNSEAVLAISGYSFGDDHINLELDKALRQSGGRLTVLVFTGADGPEGLVKEWLDDPRIREHVRLHANKGFFHADQQITSTKDLPWWRFEILIRLLGGDR